MTGRVHYCQGQTIFIKCGCKIIPVLPVYRGQTPYYPIVAGYCFTIHKIMRQTLKHITLVFDTRHLAPAVGYVALSRVSHINDVVRTYDTSTKNSFCELLTYLLKKFKQI